MHCVCLFVQDKITTELPQVLDDEEKRWVQTLHIEEYQSGLARSVIQVTQSCTCIQKVTDCQQNTQRATSS